MSRSKKSRTGLMTVLERPEKKQERLEDKNSKESRRKKARIENKKRHKSVAQKALEESKKSEASASTATPRQGGRLADKIRRLNREADQAASEE